MLWLGDWVENLDRFDTEGRMPEVRERMRVRRIAAKDGRDNPSLPAIKNKDLRAKAVGPFSFFGVAATL